MRTFDVTLQTELAADTAYLVYLLSVNFATPLYLTNADIDVYYNGQKYSSYGMDMGAMEYSLSPQLDKISIDLDNTDLTFSTAVGTSEIRAKRSLLKLAALNQNGGVIGTAIQFDGLVDSARINKKSCKLNIYNHFVNWKKPLPPRTHQATCPWPFKEVSSEYATCQYAGAATTCDKSWEQCVSYGNQLNFGGFRWLPSLVDKQIWWGRKPS